MIRLRPLAATLAAAALLTGCSNADPEIPAVAATSAPATSAPVAASTLSASTTPASMATRDPQTPELPEPGRQFSEDGASSFAIYFTQVLSQARATGNADLLRAISEPTCKGCAEYAEEIESYRDKGYTSTNTTLEFRGTNIINWDPAHQEIDMDVLLKRPAHQLVASNGSVIEDVSSADGVTGYLWLKWENDHWLVVETE